MQGILLCLTPGYYHLPVACLKKSLSMSISYSMERNSDSECNEVTLQQLLSGFTWLPEPRHPLGNCDSEIISELHSPDIPVWKFLRKKSHLKIAHCPMLWNGLSSNTEIEIGSLPQQPNHFSWTWIFPDGRSKKQSSWVIAFDFLHRKDSLDTLGSLTRILPKLCIPKDPFSFQ